MIKVQVVTVAVLVALGCLFSGPSMAQADESEGFVCAAVMPCNSDGTVQAPFDTGLCAPMYRSQCLSALANNLNESSNSCRESLDDASKRVKRLRRKVQALRRQS